MRFNGGQTPKSRIVILCFHNDTSSDFACIIRVDLHNIYQCYSGNILKVYLEDSYLFLMGDSDAESSISCGQMRPVMNDIRRLKE